MTQGPQSNPMRTNGRRYSSLPVWWRIITSSHRGNSADAGLDRPLYLRNILYDKTLKSQNYYSNNYNITYKLKHLRLQLIRNKIITNVSTKFSIYRHQEQKSFDFDQGPRLQYGQGLPTTTNIIIPTRATGNVRESAHPKFSGINSRKFLEISIKFFTEIW